MKRISVLLLLLMLLIVSGCGMGRDTTFDTPIPPPAAPGLLPPPTVIYNPSTGLFNVHFANGIDNNSGDVTLVCKASNVSVYHKGKVLTKDALATNETSGSYLIAFKGAGDGGLSANNATKIVAEGFVSSNGQTYSTAQFEIVNSTLVQSPTANLDVDNNAIVVNFPEIIEQSPAMNVSLLFPKETNDVTLYVTTGADNKSIIIPLNGTIMSYPVVAIRNMLFTESNSIIYQEVPVSTNNAPIVNGIGVNGVIKIHLVNVSPAKDISYLDKTISSPIWDIKYINSQGYNGIKELLQKYQNWEINLNSENVKRIVLLDTVNGAIVYDSTKNFTENDTVFSWNVNDHGIETGTLGIKLQALTIRLYGAVGTNYYQTNFASYIDISQTNAVLENLGIDVPSITYKMNSFYVNTGVGTNTSIITWNGAPSYLNNKRISLTLTTDVVKSYDKLTLNGIGVLMRYPLLENTVINPAYCFYEISNVNDEFYYITEDSMKWGYTLLDQSRGIYKIAKESTLNILSGGTFVSKDILTGNGLLIDPDTRKNIQYNILNTVSMKLQYSNMSLVSTGNYTKVEKYKLEGNGFVGYWFSGPNDSYWVHPESMYTDNDYSFSALYANAEKTQLNYDFGKGFWHSYSTSPYLYKAPYYNSDSDTCNMGYSYYYSYHVLYGRGIMNYPVLSMQLNPFTFSGECNIKINKYRMDKFGKIFIY